MIPIQRVVAPLVFVPLLSLVHFTVTPPLVQAQRHSTIRFDPPPPPDRGEPAGRGLGGGQRGNCLTALVPVTQISAGDLYWGLTTVDRPTLWFHLSRPLAAPTSGKWVLQDEAGKVRYSSPFTLPQQSAGTISLSLPMTVPPLQVGQSYRWSVSLECDPELVDAPVKLEGQLKRVAVPAQLQTQLAAAKTPIEKASLYANHGIWHDALTTLGLSLREQNRDRAIVAAWTDLLTQVNLGNTASTPVLPCCTPGTRDR